MLAIWASPNMEEHEEDWVLLRTCCGQAGKAVLTGDIRLKTCPHRRCLLVEANPVVLHEDVLQMVKHSRRVLDDRVTSAFGPIDEVGHRLG